MWRLVTLSGLMTGNLPAEKVIKGRPSSLFCADRIGPIRARADATVKEAPLRRVNSTVVFAAFGLLISARPSPAHHSFLAEFDQRKPVTVTGVVTKVEWQNPHAFFYVQTPALEAIYRFKQRLCYCLLEKGRNPKRCQKLARRFLTDVGALRGCGFAPLVQLGQTLYAWREEIACMWRFTRNNGITEGFHTKMEVLQRQAYGFRNFQNYRLRVKVLCS